MGNRTFMIKTTGSAPPKEVQADGYQVEGDFIHFRDGSGPVFSIRVRDVMTIERKS